jgi:hypothetical protein
MDYAFLESDDAFWKGMATTIPVQLRWECL